MSIATLVSITLSTALGIFMVMRLVKNWDKNLITKCYVALALAYLIIGPKLSHFIFHEFVFSNTTLGTAFVELVCFFIVYFGIVLSTVLGILVYLRNKSLMLEFAKSLGWLLLMSPIGIITWN